MSDPVNATSVKSQSRKRSAIVCLALAAALAALVLWFSGVSVGNNDRLFHGKLESGWIKNLKYSDDEQFKEWRGYGEEGVQVLIRGLERANHPGECTYREIASRLPSFVMQCLPKPKPDSTRTTRMFIIALLSRLENAQSAIPIIIRTLNSDDDVYVRQLALSFFISTEDEKCLLQQLPTEQKKQILPALVYAMEGPYSWDIRNTATVALRWFPEQRDIVIPLLVKALQNGQPDVQILAAESLNQIDPSAARHAGNLTVLILIAKNHQDQFGSQAAAALQKFKNDPELVVSTLIESLDNANPEIACGSVSSLLWAAKEYESHVNVIISALQKRAERSDHVGRFAKTALTKLEFQSDIKQGARIE